MLHSVNGGGGETTFKNILSKSTLEATNVRNDV